ncbi:thioredoxin [SCandidatus Aminicenantes bacterium Aminicenantia_JdfR_composite]|jgi:thioredoxin 1|nr:thioredoxin [SCandidatus Aminicenantes bacterium Aminicenantia_JdfR_composite]MCP2596853.1 thioredoxin [Candidatus Aminicenantes bacterium AC-335-G13]MCP2598657.1 thioredoxin [Candidatus Aminicenantes bacterium AC-335-L06]MCP2605535.1 thioredoxin [Candidatus Aminicenantes bacterium AC-335-O07]MCP2606538.1 thioredoxin [Candidatus Aminicenantes bacterium AC-708-I09]
MGTEVKIFTDNNFEKEVLESDLPVLVDFYAEWCGPCKALAPTIDYIAKNYNEKLKVGKINIDENIKTPSKYGIRAVPTILIFKDGKVQEMLVGLQSKEKIIEVVEKYL